MLAWLANLASLQVDRRPVVADFEPHSTHPSQVSFRAEASSAEPWNGSTHTHLGEDDVIDNSPHVTHVAHHKYAAVTLASQQQ